MMVYVVSRHIEWEGEQFLGVAKTAKAARRFAAEKFSPDQGMPSPSWEENFNSSNTIWAHEPFGSELIIQRIKVVE